ncbi:MAG: hypothetical protein K0U36_00405 [Alphaproteobacteria bacterium]|nr:hypothetical protein [Alphaproteobacteria bacterium]
MEHIPPEAYAYEVSGKPAVLWAMEGCSRQLDKRSGIIPRRRLLPISRMP